MNTRSHRQRGISLIEVLISLVIAAFGLLGLAGMQTRSLSMQIDSETRRVAAGLIEQLRERVAGLGLFLAGFDLDFHDAPGLQNADLPFAQLAAARREQHPINVLHIAGDDHAGLEFL